MLYFERVAILEINFTQIEASLTLFAFCCFEISQFLGKDMFTIEMDLHKLCNFIQVRVLKNQWPLNFTKTNFYILFCVRVPLKIILCWNNIVRIDDTDSFSLFKC